LIPRHREERAKKGLFAWCVNVPAELSDTGKRQQKFFATQDDAKKECAILKIRRRNFGSSLTSMSPVKIAEAAEAYKLLAPSGIGILDAVRAFLDAHEQRTASVTFLELFNRYLEAKSDRNAEYLRELRITRDRFPSLHDRMVSDITSLELEAVLSPLTPGARNPVMRYWRAVFFFGIKQGHLKENPVLRLDFARSTLHD
jgi:hypothetical protein